MIVMIMMMVIMMIMMTNDYDVFSSSQRISHTICTRGGRGVKHFNYDDKGDDGPPAAVAVGVAAAQGAF